MIKKLSMVVLINTLVLCFCVYAQEKKDDWKKTDLKYMSQRERDKFWEEFEKRSLGKAAALKLRTRANARSVILSGNQVTTIIYDYGSIAKPGLPAAQRIDLAWPKDPNKGMGYGYEFIPLVVSAVRDTFGQIVPVVDNSNISPSYGTYDPSGSIPWGWMPTPGYVDTTQMDIATFNAPLDPATGKPKSWPESWYNPVLRRYVWPAFLGSDATTPDEEAFWVMDDYQNMKHPYFPFPNDSSIRGLGLSLECRAFQWNNPLAEDIIFFVYRVTNTSPKTLDTVYFGMYGDPHVGGPSDYDDDWAGFISPWDYRFHIDARNMLYAYDNDGKGGTPFTGWQTGYFGYKFLESPTNSTNGLDDDGDGIVDETPFDKDAGVFLAEPNAGPKGYLQGITNIQEYTKNYGTPHPRWQGDEDGDWNPETDDVGVDGIPGTGDYGEGNGKPDQLWAADGTWLGSEPNFGLRDVHESDNIGLTSFNAAIYGSNNSPRNEPLMWQFMQPNLRDTTGAIVIEQNADNMFLYGSGPFPLRHGDTQRFSIALLFGWNLDDLVLNAVTSQQIYRANYQFALPPAKPFVKAVPGDGKVTLYWDTRAEESVDPLSHEKDFEGYKIYRSQDYTFSDVFTITDANGNPYLGQPLVDSRGKKAQFDLVDGWKGFHPVEFPGRGVKYWLGDETGLVHTYVDTPVVNGLTYYYAVVAYDRGDTGKVKVPPSETQHVIKRDPVTGQLTFDVNTVQVVPGPPPAGYIEAHLENGQSAQQVSGISTGDVKIVILNHADVVEGKEYNVIFTSDSSTTPPKVVYSVRDLAPTTEKFVSRDTNFTTLKHDYIVPGTVTVKDLDGNVISPSNYVIDYKRGSIKGSAPGKLPLTQVFQITYEFYPVFGSPYMQNEDYNPVFDGMKVYVRNDKTALDTTRSGWISRKNTNVIPIVSNTKSGTPKPFRGDFEIRFNSTQFDTVRGQFVAPGDSDITRPTPVVTPFTVWNIRDNVKAKFSISELPKTRNKRWDVGETIVLLDPDRPGTSNTTYQVIFNPKIDTVIARVDTVINGRDTTIYVKRPVDRTIMPDQGDIFLVFSRKAFVAGDVYKFKSKAAYVSNDLAKSQLDRIYVVPNPYVVFGEGELPDVSAARRGERRLEFRNLPPKCTIRIYTITGELVNTIEKDDMNSYATWNLLSYEGQNLAYGIYIYHVDAPGIGEKIGRFAVIK